MKALQAGIEELKRIQRGEGISIKYIYEKIGKNLYVVHKQSAGKNARLNQSDKYHA